MQKTTTLSPTLETKYVNPKLWEKIQQLDLTLIIERMTFKYRWSKRRTQKAISDYRQFLYLTQVFEMPLSPTKDVDMLWHDHILHTEKYAIDCKELFGAFLHHFPFPIAWIKNAAVCDGGGGTDSKCNTCNSNPPKPEPKCAADSKPTDVKAFCGVDGDGEDDLNDEPKKPKAGFVSFVEIQQYFFAVN